MVLTKLTDKSLVTNQDLEFNHRIGLPIEVYCSKRVETLAFGRIESYNDQSIIINGQSFSRQCHLFFGHPFLTS
ncbi:hypothetical protein [Halalkalibacterium ligniniphilum]|uniref:hypothetical protein n=1 Tax=Halalkalibacterium ligniniphilum TaxID=1134413 RepID=UPI0003497D55|nr:hypothetical protein [Halalkalibacterium ligniniphilum]